MTGNSFGSISASLFELAVGEEDARLCKDISDDACAEQPGNFVLQSAALSLSKIGDGLSDPKIVMPWLLGAIAAPGYLIGVLVPVRESLALLPQLLFGAVIRRFEVRKWFWAGASLVEGLCIISMAGIALSGLQGASAGWLVILLLAIFSLARGVASIASKDTLGKTIAKTRRGRVNGVASSVSGLVTGATGVYLMIVPEAERSDLVLAIMIFAAGIAWILGAAVYTRIAELPGATEGGRDLQDVLKGQFGHLLADGELRKFLVARALLLSSALSGPIYVALAQNSLSSDLLGLGALVVASGAASALSSYFWGGLSDRSSRKTMAIAAAIAGVLAIFVAVLVWLSASLLQTIWLYVAVIFLLGIAHAGVRIGRKTHLVDMAGGEKRAEYVAVSNTVIGVLLLAAGSLVAGLLSLSMALALFVLGALAIAGTIMSLMLEETQQ